MISNVTFAQSVKTSCETIKKINALIQEKHYKPRPIDDSLSVFVFNNFFDQLDDNNSIFLSSDIAQLNQYKLKIDNLIKTQNCDFLEVFFKIYNNALARQKRIIESISTSPLAYSSNDFIYFTKKKKPFLKTEAELKKLYQKRILFDLLADVAETSKNKDSIIKNFNAIAATAKTKTFDNFNCDFNDNIISKEAFFSLFINVFCSHFDPHTAYFSGAEKSDFLSGLSSSNYSFGMNMTLDKNNNLIVAELVPNGAAYYSNKIEVGDIIQKIKVNADEYKVNCNDLKKISELLESNEIKNALFTFRKKSGENYSVQLQKQLMRDAENSVYSYLLERENKRSGYIKIPSFYSTFENGKTNVSDDFKKEISKLKDLKITDLIIDLENNGGGSMQEAIKLCGFFINAQAVGQEKFAQNQIFIIPNENKKPIFSGNIIILINGYSASASEFFTNTMKDYNLALAFGTQSFGKGSSQIIFEVENEAKDFLKMTTGTFYSVTGRTNQANGIAPTIAIPSIFDDLIKREKSEKHYLKNEIISGFVSANSYPLSENLKNKIKNFNQKFQTSDDYLKVIDLKKQVNKLLNSDLAPIKLNFDSVFEYVNRFNNLYSSLEKNSKTNFEINVFSTNTNYDNVVKNEDLTKSNRIGIKEIKTNLVINEALKFFGQLN